MLFLYRCWWKGWKRSLCAIKWASIVSIYPRGVVDQVDVIRHLETLVGSCSFIFPWSGNLETDQLAKQKCFLEAT